MYDIAIIGAGAAGLTAALYALRADKKVLLVEKGAFGGQITFSPLVENFPTQKPQSGNELADRLTDQVLSMGADVEVDNILRLEAAGAEKKLIGENGSYSARAVILATGARHRMLGLPREQEFVGAGISFCAVCDGAFYRGKRVGVVGGGNSALQEALLLSDLCSRVTVIQNLPELTGEQRLIQQLRQRPNVEIICGVTVQALAGDSLLTGVTLHRVETDTLQELELDGLFIAIGLIPQNEPFADTIALDQFGYADCDESCTTGTPGVFVAGDCRRKTIRQLTTACADGSVAALAACRYLD